MLFIQKKEEIKKKENKHSTILKVPDELWDKIKSILPKAKPLRTVGSRPIIRYRKVIDEILYVLRKEDANGKCYLKNMVLVLPVIVDFRSGMD
ncbi:MAG TPA: transposase [Candidatus Nitrosocosmicus sp.]